MVISSGEFSRIIAVCSVESGTAPVQTECIWNLIVEAGIEHSIVALSHDIENTNTGENGGICKFLCDLLPKPTLRLPCRHHIDELLLKTAFVSTVEFGHNTTGPTIPLFENF